MAKNKKMIVEKHTGYVMQKGISLVALVITIIILIILTTTVIIVFKEGGVINKSIEATQRNNIRSIQESFELNIYDLMLNDITFNRNSINVLEEDDDFEKNIILYIPVMKTLKDMDINGKKYLQIIQIYEGKIYWSDTLEDSTLDNDNKTKEMLEQLGITSYFPIIYSTSEYKIANNESTAWIIGFNINESKKNITELTLPNKYIKDGKTYDITYIMRGTNTNDYINDQYPNLKKLIVPKGYKKIEYEVFHSCSKLEEVILPKGILAIGSYTFNYCTLLNRINLPDGLKDIGDWAFVKCEKIESIHLPDSITQIGERAFYNCYKLKNINIPENLTTIKRGLFSNCRELEKVTFSEKGKLKEIVGYSFEYCEKLGSKDNGVLTIPEGVTYIGRGAFYNCTSLTTVNLPSTLTTVDECVFPSCNTNLIINVNRKASECADYNSDWNCKDYGKTNGKYTVNYISE